VYAAVNFIVRYSGLKHFINKIKAQWLVICLATDFLHHEIIEKRTLLLDLNGKHCTFFLELYNRLSN